MTSFRAIPAAGTGIGAVLLGLLIFGCESGTGSADSSAAPTESTASTSEAFGSGCGPCELAHCDWCEPPDCRKPQQICTCTPLTGKACTGGTCKAGVCVPPPPTSCPGWSQLSADGSTCVACGVPSTPPCTEPSAGETGCEAQTVLVNGVCVSCGGNGDVPCAGVCDPGTSLVNGKCSVPCGATNQPACPADPSGGGQCNAGDWVSDGVCCPYGSTSTGTACFLCGAQGDIACGVGVGPGGYSCAGVTCTCDPGLALSGNTCVCGGAGQPPCPTTFTPLTNQPASTAYGMWLMVDGTVLAQLKSDSQTLVKLTPDVTGSYANGRWSPAGSFLLPKANYASQVLSNGKLVTCGGEQSGPNLNGVADTNYCEVYDPTTTPSSTALIPPATWTNIGDSPSVVLPDGRMLLGNQVGFGGQVALLDPTSLTWTVTPGGDSGLEQGYTLLQTGDVLTPRYDNVTSYRYSVLSGAFTADANVPVALYNSAIELGPGMTLMDGRAIWFGGTGHTAIYTPTTQGHNGSWVAGQEMPVIQDQTLSWDSAGILEPNGRVMVAVQGVAVPDAGPSTPQQFVEYDPGANRFYRIGGSPSGWNYPRALVLPNGHGLVALNGAGWFDVQFSTGPQAQWAPTITSFPSTVQAGTTVTLSGTQLAGLSEAANFGDDNQQAENYPIVRVTNFLGGVRYLRAHDVSTRSIAPGQVGTVSVDIPADLPAISYTLNVVAIGIPSNGVTVTVTAP